MAFQVVHGDDLAAAIALLIERRAGGAFNVAAPPVIDRAVWRTTFGGVGPQLPPKLIRLAADASWRARVQPTEPGWIDLAAQVPVMDTARIEALGWRATHDAADVVKNFITAMRTHQGHGGPLLRPGR
jgi:UDP-glucose 4-epimerase